MVYISEFRLLYSVIVAKADESIEVPSYRVPHSVRDGRKGGGVTLMYRDSFTTRNLTL